MKKAKAKQSKLSNKYLILAGIIVVLLGVGAFVLLKFTVDDGDVGRSINYQRSFEITGETREVAGKITKKTTSCGREILQEDGSVKRGPVVCDGGNSITVGGISISTGGGALTGRAPKYISDIDGITAGDNVSVRYALDENGRASTNCKACYIKKR